MPSKSLARVHRPTIGLDGKVIKPFNSTRESGTIPVAQTKGEGTAEEAILSGQVAMEQSAAAPALQQQMRIIDQALKKYEPDIRKVLDYYFDNFESLERSAYKRSDDYEEFLNTFRTYFFPERITSWHWNGKTCVDSGPRGAHKSYREFLSYIVRNVETFNPLQYTRIILLLTRFEETAIGRKTYIEKNKGNNDILRMFMKYDVNKKNDGKYKFCKERTVMTNGIAINNLKVIRLLRGVFRSRFPVDAAAADSYNYDSEDDSEDDDGGGGGPGGMEAAEGGSNRSRRAPIRRKSENRRTPRRRNKTRKYYKK
jgi:hypothetical protein